jgi:hypothetical protein
MRSLITTMALLIFSSVAMAQTGGTASPTSPTSQENSSRFGREAPIGHRQPRADQVPSEKNLGNPNDPINREDAALDRKIKSICRGC